MIAAALAAIGVVFVVLACDGRADARRAAESAEANLATALARDLDRNVELLDLSIQAARDGWADPRVRALDPAMRQLVVFDHSASAEFIDAILVVDRHGAALADSRSTVPPTRNFGDRDFLLAQRDHDAGLFIGKPMLVPGKPGWHIALSRRLTADDGSFGGVAVGFLNLDYLAQIYRHLPLGEGGLLSLANTDGTLLVREPELPGTVGLSMSGRTTFDALNSAAGGTYEGLSMLDDRRRLYAFRRVGTLPLIQVVATSTESVYAAWRAKTAALGAVLVVLCSGVLLLLAVLRRELVQRMRAERALDALASTDHLTGLLNRRRFFEGAGSRCAEAARDGSGLAVLMIDADHFKSYNDRYGHLAGDHALAAIGGAIAAELRRDIDLAARYGGEEFIVLMPGFDGPRAFVTAEAIRTAVARLALPHERSTAGVVTVSTGLACSAPGGVADLKALIEAADGELYRSKRDGRNRSSGGAPEGPCPLPALTA
jgi:diguanylate cyclase (GGDEF)-like protein